MIDPSEVKWGLIVGFPHLVGLIVQIAWLCCCDGHRGSQFAADAIQEMYKKLRITSALNRWSDRKGQSRPRNLHLNVLYTQTR